MTEKVLETFGIKLNFVQENVYDKPKLQTSKAVDQNEQQQQQPANYSSDNAEIARCLTPFSHPCKNLGKQSARTMKTGKINAA